ncbi:hypothetical protein SARC_08950 [Sphaeroforma arctica JP610]|uniref:Uncharacterized protein n=1 Tax=Sphaeroforma arctica JP610 TaxID=667725 RepID=A0A0L0FP97_9EUKA|nr:hypothetical protein SARC_08950 [Sphaeroforma arctica JP610]KNC78630.1 hypothetical protein SARC_08950 [Sphaeroforma arctica JP610]|eukprot:XP_014152532.1 hypothetical protein SARC_08950 [Sphaeroforma arctica JP610]
MVEFLMVSEGKYSRVTVDGNSEVLSCTREDPLLGATTFLPRQRFELRYLLTCDIRTDGNINTSSSTHQQNVSNHGALAGVDTKAYTSGGGEDRLHARDSSGERSGGSHSVSLTFLDDEAMQADRCTFKAKRIEFHARPQRPVTHSDGTSATEHTKEDDTYSVQCLYDTICAYWPTGPQSIMQLCRPVEVWRQGRARAYAKSSSNQYWFVMRLGLARVDG